MELLIFVIIAAVVALGLGVFVGRTLVAKANKTKELEIEEKAKLIIKEAEVSAESIKKDKILEAKEKFIKLKAEFEEDTTRKKNQIITNENKLKQKEQHLSKEFEKINRKENDLSELKEKYVLSCLLSSRKELSSKKNNKIHCTQSDPCTHVRRNWRLFYEDSEGGSRLKMDLR